MKRTPDLIILDESHRISSREAALLRARSYTANAATKNPCGDPRCGASTGIHEGLTFGRGRLDRHGFWEIPCRPCAAAWDAAHPNDPNGPAWPFAEKESK